MYKKLTPSKPHCVLVQFDTLGFSNVTLKTALLAQSHGAVPFWTIPYIFSGATTPVGSAQLLAHLTKHRKTNRRWEAGKTWGAAIPDSLSPLNAVGSHVGALRGLPTLVLFRFPGFTHGGSEVVNAGAQEFCCRWTSSDRHIVPLPVHLLWFFPSNESQQCSTSLVASAGEEGGRGPLSS